MIDSMGSTTLSNIEVSSLQFAPCHYCARQRIPIIAEAWLILSNQKSKTISTKHVRVMCNNGHIFSVPRQVINRK